MFNNALIAKGIAIASLSSLGADGIVDEIDRIPNKIERNIINKTTSDSSQTMGLSILNIKESSKTDYQTFENTTNKIVLKDNCNAGNGLVHNIDLMLKGSIAHEKDIYKTVIKFEVEQK